MLVKSMSPERTLRQYFLRHNRGSLSGKMLSGLTHILGLLPEGTNGIGLLFGDTLSKKLPVWSYQAASLHIF